jgi:hypothetical protein
MLPAMGELIPFVFGDATLGEAFIADPVITIIKCAALLITAAILCIFAALIVRGFGPKSSQTLTSTVSYGQGGSAGPGGRGGDGGNVLHIEQFPVMTGAYKIKVGKGGIEGEGGEESSITTPLGQVLTAEGGKGGKYPESDTAAKESSK